MRKPTFILLPFAACLLGSGALAQDASGALALAPPPGEESLEKFATQFYAQKYSVSLSEAERQIAEIKRVGEAMRAAGIDSDDSSAGLAIDRANGFQIAIRYAGGKGPAISKLERQGFTTIRVQKAKKTLKDDVRTVARTLGVKNNEYATIYDDLANTATLLIKGSAADFPALPPLPEGVTVEFQDELITLTANIYGTDSIAEGGTVGWTADYAGSRGMTAAGHIHNNFSSFTVNGDRQTIRLKRYDAQNDVVWANSTSSLYGAHIRVTSAGAWKVVGSVGNLHSATPYCKYGRTTKVTCGIYSRTYTGPWQSFSSGTFPLIKGDVQMALDGDSGGPVFEDLGTKVSAIGTVIGHTGAGKELVVYPINRITALGMTIVTQ